MDPAPLPESLFWNIQDEGHRRWGPFSWSISNTTFMATAYAGIIQAYVEATPGITQGQPLYILDLGAGTGRFSYLLLRALEKITLPVEVRVICVERHKMYAESWANHPRFAPFLKEGRLDYICGTAWEEDPAPLLQHSGQRLEWSCLANPLIAIANYFFDQIPQEVLRWTGTSWEQGLLHITSPDGITSLEKLVENKERLCALRFHYSFTPLKDLELISKGDPLAETVLRAYADQLLPGTKITWPVMGLRLLRRLYERSKGRLLTLLADKGGRNLEELMEDKTLVPIYQQGVFSFDLNLDAIYRYWDLQGGWSFFLPEGSRRFSLSVLHSGLSQKAQDFDRRASWQLGVAAIPVRYGQLQEFVTTPQHLDVKRFITLIECFEADPSLLRGIQADFLQSLTKKSNIGILEVLGEGMLKIYRAFFWAEKGDGNLLVRLAQVLYLTGKLSETADCLEEAIALSGGAALPYHYLALCYERLGREEEAQLCFEHSRRFKNL